MEFVVAFIFFLVVLGFVVGAIITLVKNKHRHHSMHAGYFLNPDEPDCGESAAAANHTVVNP